MNTTNPTENVGFTFAIYPNPVSTWWPADWEKLFVLSLINFI